MFTQGSHADIKSSLDAIGAAVAVFSLDKDDRFTLISANDTFPRPSSWMCWVASANAWARCFPATSPAA